MSDIPSFDRCVAENAMLPRGTRVLAAVSGGADSMCLLSLLHELAPELGISLCAAHFNHGIRGAEAERDESFVVQQCRDMGIDCVVGHADVPAEAAARHLGTEECARLLRYEFLERTAGDKGCTLIATAHNADDELETVLMNLARGAGLKGLCGIPPVRGRLIRPLLYTTRAEIEAYLSARGLPHVEDSTNSDTHYTRNYIRHELMPRMRTLNPSAAAAAARAAVLLRRDEEYFERETRKFLDAAGAELDVDALMKLHPALRSRVLRGFAANNGAGELTSAHTEAMEGLMRSADPHAALNLPGLKLRREYGRIVCGDADAAESVPAELADGGEYRLPDGRLLRCVSCVMPEKIHSNLSTIYIGSAIIVGALILRPRQSGDSIELPARPRKTLKKLFNELHIPAARRGSVPVIADDAGVLAVPGVGVDRRCAVPAGAAALMITITEK